MLASFPGPRPWPRFVAVLGTYLMYVFVALAAWRVLIENWMKLKGTRLIYLAVAMIALCALLYQGKTGGELVYNHAVGTTHVDTGLASEGGSSKGPVRW